MENKTSLLNGLSPAQTFAVGLVGGIMSLCTLGFFFMLYLYFGSDTGSGVNTNPYQNNPQVNNGTDTLPSGQENNVPISFRPVDAKRDHIAGKKGAKVTVIEYSDLECPFCQRFHPAVKQLLNEYGDKVQFVYRHYPLSFHASARPAANAAECAGEQGKFFEYLDQAFAAQLDSTKIDNAYATAAGVKNMDQFKKCYDSKKYDNRIDEDSQDAMNAGLQGTPHTLIIGEDGVPMPLSGAVPYASLKQAVDQKLSK